MGGFLSTFNGPTHQSIDEIYLIGNLANFDVFFPATEYEMVLFIKKFNFSRSVYIRYNPINNKILNKVINKNYKPNKKLIGNGKNIIISYGVCSEQIFKILHENKFLKNKFKLYNFSLITNLNKTFFLYLAKKSNNLLIVEDHVNKGSLSEKIKVLLYENKIKINLISKNLGNKYFQPKKTLDELFKKYDITKKYLENLNFKQ
jgi:1-deoxy-D-xylulose-5-phosphate synthase